MAPHSSTLAWKIPWTEEPGRLQSMGSLRVGWLSDFTFTFTRWGKKWQPTPVFLPWESQGQESLVGCCLWWSHRVGHDWSNLAAAAPDAFLIALLIFQPYLLPFHYLSNILHSHVSFLEGAKGLWSLCTTWNNCPPSYDIRSSVMTLPIGDSLLGAPLCTYGSLYNFILPVVL